MHHKKKRKLFVHYSIPIINNLCNKFNRKKYLVSYSIPLSCMVVLLLGGVMMINPSLFANNEANALEVIDSVDNDNIPTDSEDEFEKNENIISFAEVQIPSIALTIASGTDGYGINDGNGGIAAQVETAPGAGTAYRSHNISVTGNGIVSYSLNISGSPDLSGGTTISGADGKKGSAMSDNTWGYAWGNTGDDVTDMTYNSMSNTASTLTCPAPVNNNVNCTGKKLVFAAKFGTNASYGTYTSTVNLSLTSTAIVIGALWSNGLDSGIDSMQNISSGFCKNNSKIAEGDTITLKDTRGDGTSYKIVKLRDGNCWMQENLALGPNITLTSADSDVSGDFTTPTDTSNWSSSNTTSQMKVGSTALNASWVQEWGNYYSWNAATANTGGSLTGWENAPDSICPKGWKLPTGAGSGQFIMLFGTDGINLGNELSAEEKFSAIQAEPYKFPAAGYYDSGGFKSAGSNGRYWSSTSYVGGSGANLLYFTNSKLFPGINYDYNGYIYRNYGYSVRCVASY